MLWNRRTIIYFNIGNRFYSRFYIHQAVAALAGHFPPQIIGPEIHKLLEEGPNRRRQESTDPLYVPMIDVGAPNIKSIAGCSVPHYPTGGAA